MQRPQPQARTNDLDAAGRGAVLTPGCGARQVRDLRAERSGRAPPPVDSREVDSDRVRLGLLSRFDHLKRACAGGTRPLPLTKGQLMVAQEQSRRAGLAAAVALAGLKQTEVGHEFGITRQAAAKWLQRRR